MLKTSPLHGRYGVRVQDIQLNSVTAANGFSDIREAFETHSLLYFSDQSFSDEAHLRLGALFGPKEDRTIHTNQPLPAVSLVSNITADQELCKPGEKRLYELQANMLWHTDSTFLPVPALANILVGRVIPASGSVTEFASTRAALDDMPIALKDRIRDLYLRHQYGHSRRKVNPELADNERYSHWGEQIWKAIWTNPVNSTDSLYIASHACGAIGMENTEAQNLIDELTDWCTQAEYVYAHRWQVGDVLIWDERAVLHRGRPWNYDEARSLSSICISVRAEDGFDSVKYQPA